MEIILPSNHTISQMRRRATGFFASDDAPAASAAFFSGAVEVLGLDTIAPLGFARGARDRDRRRLSALGRTTLGGGARTLFLPPPKESPLSALDVNAGGGGAEIRTGPPAVAPAVDPWGAAWGAGPDATRPRRAMVPKAPPVGADPPD